MINTCYTTTNADADWIFVDCLVQEDKWDEFMNIKEDPNLIEQGIVQGWIIVGEHL
jgi:hypothetical protein